MRARRAAGSSIVLSLTIALPVFDARAGTVQTAPAPIWIFLRDKGFQSPQAERLAVEQARSSVDPTALKRRELRGVDDLATGEQDLPVSSSYAKAIAATGATIRVESKWLNAISVQATPAQLAAIDKLNFVDHLQPVAQVSQQSVPEPANNPTFLPANVSSHSTNSAPATQDFYGLSSAQLTQINIPAVHNLGYHGEGMVIGVLDSGFRRTHDAFNYPGHSISVLAEHDFLDGDNDTSETTNGQNVHGTWVLSVMGAYEPNSLVGGAYNASFVLAKTEDVSQEVPAEEDNWVAGLEYLEAHGADVVTSSLGYIDWYTQAQLDGKTAVTTIAAAAAAAHGLAITNAAGNEGHDTNPATSHLIAPADADLLITVGAVDSSNVAASFTSDGPTADGRVKPEVTALGVNDALVDTSSDTGYVTASGTSFATPLTASAVTLILQAHPDWDIYQLRYALFNTASRGGTFDPQYIVGYGLINTLAAVQYSFDTFYTGPNGVWGTTGNWTTQGTPTTHNVPFSLTNVFIQPTTGVSVTGPASAATINKLTINSTTSGTALLTLNSNATFTVSRDLSIGSRGQITQSIGSFIVSGTVASDGRINQTGGTSSLPTVTGAGSINVNFGASMTADSITQSSLTVGGQVSIRQNGTPTGLSKIGTLSIPGGTFDLADNDLIATGTSYLSITSNIAAARNHGAWNQPGLTSTIAAGGMPKITTLGAVSGAEFHSVQGATATFDNSPVADSDILVKYTYYGDDNFNGRVDGGDYARMDLTFAAEATSGNIPGWANGDFDYNGKVDGADYALADLAFTAQSGTLARALAYLDGSDPSTSGMNDSSLANVVHHFAEFGDLYASTFLATVPEPAMGIIIPSAVMCTLLRRRRRFV